MRLRECVSMIALTLIVPSLASGQGLPPNVRLNSCLNNLQNEEQIWINLTDSLNVIADWRDFCLGYRRVGVGVSTDGGATWTDQLNPATPYDWESDPCLVGHQDGTFYLNVLNFDPGVPQGSGSSLITVWRSTNKGVTWTGPVSVSPEGPHFEDKQFTAVDRTGGPYDGNYYVSWTRFNNPTRIMFARSTDGAQTFDDTITVGPVVNTSSCGTSIDQGQFSIPIVNSDGSVHVFWQGYDVDSSTCDFWSAIRHAYSTNGGVTFTEDTAAFRINLTYSAVDGGINVYGMPNGDADISGGPYDGTIYIAQTQLGSEVLAGTDVHLRKSTDNGISWTAPSKVNDDAPGQNIDQFHPWLAVNEDGVVLVVFYDQRNDPVNHYLFDCYFSASFDGGETFITNYRLSSTSSSPTDLSTATESVAAFMDEEGGGSGPGPTTPAWLMNPMAGLIAEYIGVHAKHDYVVAVWTDTREGTQDVYSALFTIPFMKPRLYEPADGGQACPGNSMLRWSTCWHEDADLYRVEVTTDASFATIDSSYITTDNELLISHLIFPGIDYHWRVKAFRAEGDSTEYSEVRSFQIVAIPNCCYLMLDYPPNGVVVKDTNVNLIWTNDTYGFPEVRLLVDTNPNFASPLVDTTDYFLGSFLLSDLNDSTQYYWRVYNYRMCDEYFLDATFTVETCPIELTGDLNHSGTITSADIIEIVNFVFKGGPPPLPYIQVADVNCTNSVTSADIIYLVNYLFKSGPEPCDACTTL